MVFNTNLIPEAYKNSKKYTDLAKLLLFILDQKIDVRSTLINKVGVTGMTISLDFNEDVVGDLNDVILALEANDVVERSYAQDTVRWRLIRKLYVNELKYVNIDTDTVKEIRSYFMKGYCGESNRNAPEKMVRTHIKIFLENNPLIEIGDIQPVFKYVVDLNPSYTPNILKLIDNEGEYPTKNLLSYYEEYKENDRGTTFI